MKIFLLTLPITLLVSTNTVAQSQNPFKLRASEIWDYNSVPNRTVFIRYKAELDQHQERTDSLFTYPEGSVVYVLNGESFTDREYVRRVLFQHRDRIETIIRKQPDIIGRYVFEIKYKSN